MTHTHYFDERGVCCCGLLGPRKPRVVNAQSHAKHAIHIAAINLDAARSRAHSALSLASQAAEAAKKASEQVEQAEKHLQEALKLLDENGSHATAT